MEPQEKVVMKTNIYRSKCGLLTICLSWFTRTVYENTALGVRGIVVRKINLFVFTATAPTEPLVGSNELLWRQENPTTTQLTTT